MVLGDIATQARFLTNSDSTSYPDANLLININNWYQKIVTMILESMDLSDFDDASISTTYPIATRTLANRRDYAYATAAWTLLGKEGGAGTTNTAILPLKVKRLDISYDGGSNYYKAEPLDAGEIQWGIGNDANIDQNYIKEAPRYDVQYNSILLYPMPLASDVAAGAIMRVEFLRDVVAYTSADLTAGTAVPGIDAPYHMMIAEGAAKEYAQSRQLPQVAELAQSLVDWELRLRTAYGRKQLDAIPRMEYAYDDNWGR